MIKQTSGSYPVADLETGNQYRREVTLNVTWLCYFGRKYWLHAKMFLMYMLDETALPMEGSFTRKLGAIWWVVWGIIKTLPFDLARAILLTITWPAWAIHEIFSGW